MNLLENHYYVYKHINKITNEIFYIGVGSNFKNKNYKRAYFKYNRNNYWKNIVNKYDYYVEIIYDNLSKEQSFLIEKQLIKYYGRSDLKKGTLCNMTDGGEGQLKRIWTDKDKLQLSLKKKGVKVSEKEKIRLKLLDKGVRRSKLVLNIETGIFYESAKEAAFYINLKYRTLHAMLTGQNPNKTSLLYV